MAAKTGLSPNEKRRWHEIRFSGKIAEQEKFVDAYLIGSYPNRAISLLTEEEKLTLLSESLLNHMHTVVAFVADSRVRIDQATRTQELIAAELASMTTSGVE